MKILVLGGTADARKIANELTKDGQIVISSLAGRVSSPQLPTGEVRIGGFGGTEGLADWLKENHIDLMIDATHPFAAQITQNAARASKETGISFIKFTRPGWESHTLSDSWHWINNHSEAAQLAAKLGKSILLTVGRQSLDKYADLKKPDKYVVARVADDTNLKVNSDWRIICARGPFSLTDEIKLINEESIEVLVSKNSGGSATESKLVAAHQCGIEVLMISRPDCPLGVRQFFGIDELLKFIKDVSR